MKLSGKVIRASTAGMSIAVDLQSCGACSQSGSCGISSISRVSNIGDQSVDGAEIGVGSRVAICVPDGELGRAAGLAYGMPLLFALLGALIAQSLVPDPIFGRELVAPFGCLVGASIGFLVLNRIEFQRVRVETMSDDDSSGSGTCVPLMTLVGRGYCHLCTEMQTALETASDLPDFQFEVLDVDSDPALLEQYDELVPVLLTQAGHEICHHRIDLAKVREYLQRFE